MEACMEKPVKQSEAIRTYNVSIFYCLWIKFFNYFNVFQI